MWKIKWDNACEGLRQSRAQSGSFATEAGIRIMSTTYSLQTTQLKRQSGFPSRDNFTGPQTGSHSKSPNQSAGALSFWTYTLQPDLIQMLLLAQSDPHHFCGWRVMEENCPGHERNVSIPSLCFFWVLSYSDFQKTFSTDDIREVVLLN